MLFKRLFASLQAWKLCAREFCVLPPQPPVTVCQRPGSRKRAAFARCRQEDHQDGDEDDDGGEVDDGDVLLNFGYKNPERWKMFRKNFRSANL